MKNLGKLTRGIDKLAEIGQSVTPQSKHREADSTRGDYAHSDSLVSIDWVVSHGQDENVRLVEVDVDTSAYGEGHIAGAVGWNWQDQLQQSIQRDILQKKDLELLLGNSGIDSNTTVILYGDNNNWFAAWAFWQLKYYGHQDVKLMNGGRSKWIAEGRPLDTAVPSYGAKRYRASGPNETIRGYRDGVLKSVEKGGVCLVDVREPEEYNGLLLAPPNRPQEGCQRGGHIPRAINIPWGQAVMEDGSFKTVDDLWKLYNHKGIDGSKEIITYCSIGERASHTWFVLTQLLGFQKVKNYDGSWTEWGNSIAVPISNPSRQDLSR